jgi:hypothetical protein
MVSVLASLYLTPCSLINKTYLNIQTAILTLRNIFFYASNDIVENTYGISIKVEIYEFFPRCFSAIN